MDLPVKTARTQQCGVENVRTVGRRHDDDPLVGLKTVHLHEQLVERLLAFVVSAAETRAALAADGVDLVDKDDAGLALLRRVKQIADTARTHTDKHFHKVRTGNGEERNVRLPRHGLCKQRFTRSGRPYQQNALRNARTEIGKFLRALEELHHFGKLRLFLLRTRNVRKTDFDVGIDPRFRLGKAHRLAASALRLTNDQPEHDAYQRDPEQRHEITHKAARVRVSVGYRDPVALHSRPERFGHRIVLSARPDRLVDNFAFLQAIIDIVVYLDLIDFLCNDLVVQLGEVDLLGSHQHRTEHHRKDHDEHYSEQYPEHDLGCLTHI